MTACIILCAVTSSHALLEIANCVYMCVCCCLATEPLPAGRKEEPAKPSSISLPSTMLTPISNLPSPTVDMTSFKQPSHSPPNSGMATPTEGPARFPKQRDSIDMAGGGGASSSTSSLPERKNSVGTQSVTPPCLAGTVKQTSQDPQSHHESKKGKNVVAKQTSASCTHQTLSESHPSSSVTPASASPRTVPTIPSRPPLQPLSNPLSPPRPSFPSHPLSPVGIVLTPTLAGGGTRSPGGGILVQSQIRGPGATHSTVLASPIKCHPPQPNPDPQQQQQVTPHTQQKEKEEDKKKREKSKEDVDEGSKDEGGREGGSGGSARTDCMGPPTKRLRVTRRSVAEEEQARQ